MRLVAAVAAVGLALVAAAAAAHAAEAVPTRDCGTRTEPTRGHLRFASPGDVVIGPVAFSGLAAASAPASTGGRRSTVKGQSVSLRQRVCGKPRSTVLVAGSGHREVTTLPRV